MTLRALVVAAALALASGRASATPRYAVRNGAPCALCHVNPSGGGMRTAYGRAIYARQRLTSPAMARWLGDRGSGPDPRLGRSVAVGADVRAGYFRTDPATGPATLDSFLLMQADVYLSADLGRRATLYIDKGAYAGFEAFGLLQHQLRETADDEDAPARDAKTYGYLKIGRFVPTFGLRLDSHSTFTREGINLGAPARDTGVELGLYRGPLLLQASYLKGTLTDQDRGGQGILRAELLRGGNGLKVQLGGSLAYLSDQAAMNPGITVPLDVTKGVSEWRVGAHLAASLGRVTYLGELVWLRDESAANEEKARALVSYHELDLLIRQGFDAQLTYEAHDPDLYLMSGALQRGGVSLEIYPAQGAALRTLFRRTWAPAAHPSNGAWDAVVVLHLFL